MNTWSSPCTMSSQNRRPRSSINARRISLCGVRARQTPSSRMSASSTVLPERRSASGRPIQLTRGTTMSDSCCSARAMPSQRVGTKIVVSIVEEGVRPGGFGESAITASAGTPGVLLLKDLDVRSTAFELAQIAPRAIR